MRINQRVKCRGACLFFHSRHAPRTTVAKKRRRSRGGIIRQNNFSALQFFIFGVKVLAKTQICVIMFRQSGERSALRQCSPPVHPPFGGIAQLVERLNGIQKVRGSIPLVSTSQKLKRTLVVLAFFCCGLTTS